MPTTRREKNNVKSDARRQVQRELNEIVRRYNAALHVACVETRTEYRGVMMPSGDKDYSIHIPNAMGRQIDGTLPFEGATSAHGRPL